MTRFDYQMVKAEGAKGMKTVRFLVSGWNILPDGSYHKFISLCDLEKAQTYLCLAAMRNSDSVDVKVYSIEVVWNADSWQ